MFRDLLSSSVVEINDGGCIQPRNGYQSVLRDRDARWIELALRFFESQLPIEGPYRPGLEYKPDEAKQHADESRMTAESVKRLNESLRSHYDKVERANEKKGQATIEQDLEQRQFELGPPTYHKVSKLDNMVAGGAMGALGATALGCGAVVATGGLALIALVPMTGFAGTIAGATAARASTQTKYKRVQRYELPERTVTRKANGEVVKGKWLPVPHQQSCKPKEEVVDEDEVPVQCRE